MTRYSASRGIMYSAPPAATEDADAGTEAEADTDADAEPTPADD